MSRRDRNQAQEKHIAAAEARNRDLQYQRDRMRDERDEALAKVARCRAWLEQERKLGTAVVADLEAELDRTRAALAQVQGERDRARATGVELEQQIDAVRAGLAVAAGEVRGFGERHTDQYVRGQYETLVGDLAVVLETTGERYPDMTDDEAADELARALDQGDIEHAGQKLPQPLDLDDEAREQARMDEARNVAGYPHFGAWLGVSA